MKSIKTILAKFDRFDPETDCLVMSGADGRFSFYTPDRYVHDVVTDSVPDHVLMAVIFSYLVAHADEHRDIADCLIDKALRWVHGE